MLRRDFLAFASATGAMAASGAQAQSWPAKPITLVYPYAAGGGGDPAARLLAEQLSRRLGQSVIVENRTGAAGMIGAGAVAHAPADGYMFLFGVSGEIAINQWLYKKMPYDPEKDLLPVCRLMTLPLLLVASTASGIRSVDDLIARAKGSGAPLNYASPGSGSLQHLAAEMLMRMANVRMTHVPYRGVAAVTTDLLAGTVDVGFVGLPTALPHVRSGKMVALGTSTARRSAAAPDLPALAESRALQSFDLTQWFGMMAPAGTPAPIVDRMHREVAASLAEETSRIKLSAQGNEPAVNSPAEFAQFIRAERERFGRIVREAQITVEG